MRRIALLCPMIILAGPGLSACLENQGARQGNDAKGATEGLGTNPNATDTGGATTAPDTTDTTPPDTATSTTPGTTPTDTTSPETTECLAVNADCMAGTCCAGLACIGLIDTYIPPTCQAPRPDGTSCGEDSWCTSGHCLDGTCGQLPECSSEGRKCIFQDACCAGLVCTGSPYAYGECMRKQPLHAYCEDARWCESGLCADGACVAPSCQPNGVQCESTECCSGLCRSPIDSYGPAVCTPPAPDGAWCDWDGMCASGKCADGNCAAAACAARGSECWGEGICCASDFCSYTGMDYTPGECLGKRDVGGPCDQDSWCRSGHCADGYCAH